MWDYKKDAKVRAAIDSRNLLRLRATVNGVLLDDPSDSEGLAVDLLAFIKREVPDIMVAHTETWATIVSDRSKWTVEYRNLMVAALIKNFSEIRFLHVLQVGKHVHDRQQSVTPSDQTRRSISGKTKVLLLGAGCALVVGLILLRKSTLMGAIVAIASGACGAYVLLNKKERI